MFNIFKKLKKIISPNPSEVGEKPKPGKYQLDRDFLNQCVGDPQVLVEITSRCNFSCTYCSSSFKERKKLDMPIELFKRIVRQLPGITRKAIRLHIDGEPTLHPEFHRMAKLVNEHGLPVSLATNGSLLNPEFLDLDMNLTITLSTSATELSERHKKLDYERYVNRVIDYVKMWTRQKTTQSIRIQIIYDNKERKNEDYYSAKEEFIRDFIEQSNLSGYQSTEKGTSRFFTKSAGEFLEFSKHFLTTQGLYPEKGKRRPCIPAESGFCDSPWKRLAILADGSISYGCKFLPTHNHAA